MIKNQFTSILAGLSRILEGLGRVLGTSIFFVGGFKFGFADPGSQCPADGAAGVMHFRVPRSETVVDEGDETPYDKDIRGR